MTFPLMIFAAGHGTRMRPLTDHLPKPMIEVAGRPLIDRALDHAAEAGLHRIVVNTHYRGAQIVAHLDARADISISHEVDHALETGGGLKRALPLLGPGPVFTLNPDAVWTGANPLTPLAQAWDGESMGALLLLVPLDQVRDRAQSADFGMDADGRLRRHPEAGGTAFAYTGVQIIDPAGLQEIDAEVFSLNILWNRMIAKGRLFGLVHQGGWAPVGRPENIAEAEALLAEAGDV
jgi:MurNAc alpha-1-phosphate uridylyltransferase